MINISNLNKSNYNKQYLNIISGIYGIYYNNLLYIGSSNNLFKRLSIHRHWIKMKEEDNIGFLLYNLLVYKYIRKYNIPNPILCKTLISGGKIFPTGCKKKINP